MHSIHTNFVQVGQQFQKSKWVKRSQQHGHTQSHILAFYTSGPSFVTMSGLTKMRYSREVFASLGHLNSLKNTVCL